MSYKSEDRGILIGLGIAALIYAMMEMIIFVEGDSDEIYLKHIEQALDVCEGNEGLWMIEGEIGNTHEFKCRNGAVFVYDRDRDITE